MLTRAVLPATLALVLAGCVSLSPDPPESLLTLTAMGLGIYWLRRRDRRGPMAHGAHA